MSQTMNGLSDGMIRPFSVTAGRKRSILKTPANRWLLLLFLVVCCLFVVEFLWLARGVLPQRGLYWDELILLTLAILLAPLILLVLFGGPVAAFSGVVFVLLFIVGWIYRGVRAGIEEIRRVVGEYRFTDRAILWLGENWFRLSIAGSAVLAAVSVFYYVLFLSTAHH